MKQPFDLNKYKYPLSLFSELMGIPIMFIDANKKMLFQSPNYPPLNPLYKNWEDYIRNLPLEQEKKVIINKSGIEKVSILAINNEDRLDGWLIIGPVTFPQPTHVTIKNWLKKENETLRFEEFEKYFLTLPIFSSQTLIKVSSLISFPYLGNDLNDFKELEKYKQVEENLKKPSTQYISELKQNAEFHHDPISEKKQYQYIESGAVDEIINQRRKFKASKDFKLGKLSINNDLRNRKNLGIATITLATRAAISGGLNSEVAYSLGDVFIQQLENIREVSEVEGFIEEMLYEFTERVAISKRQHYSKKISDCEAYILNNIYEPFQIKDIAKALRLNEKYISSLFKKEVGVTLSTFIQKTKIDEAKKLMRYTTYSWREIYTLLNFSDQSYFIKVFKRHANMTPKQFMNRNKE